MKNNSCLKTVLLFLGGLVLMGILFLIWMLIKDKISTSSITWVFIFAIAFVSFLLNTLVNRSTRARRTVQREYPQPAKEAPASNNQFGTAGKSTREMQARRRRTIYIILGAVVLITIAGVIFLLNKDVWHKYGIWALAILVFLYLLPGIADLFLKKPQKEFDQFKRGAVGEEEVGALLAQLDPQNYVVMHDWKSPYGNIDHIVYDSRGTIFMLETKSHRGTVTSVNGKLLLNNHDFEKDIIQQALDNSIWMNKKITKELGVKAWITPALVFTNAFVAPGKPIKNVHCVNKTYLLEFIQRTKASSPAGVKLWEMRKGNSFPMETKR